MADVKIPEYQGLRLIGRKEILRNGDRYAYSHQDSIGGFTFPENKDFLLMIMGYETLSYTPEMVESMNKPYVFWFFRKTHSTVIPTNKFRAEPAPLP
jgi:hypothetical protein